MLESLFRCAQKLCFFHPSQPASRILDKAAESIESLTKQIAEQEARIRSLIEEIESLKSEKVVLQQSADTLARLQAEAASEVAQVLRRKLQAEWEEVKRAPVSQEIVDRINGVLLQINIVEDLKSKDRG